MVSLLRITMRRFRTGAYCRLREKLFSCVEKGSFRKALFFLEFQEMSEILDSLQSVEKEGESNHCLET